MLIFYICENDFIHYNKQDLDASQEKWKQETQSSGGVTAEGMPASAAAGDPRRITLDLMARPPQASM